MQIVPRAGLAARINLPWGEEIFESEGATRSGLSLF
jgi:hypothetical protein